MSASIRNFDTMSSALRCVRMAVPAMPQSMLDPFIQLFSAEMAPEYE